MTHRWKSAVDFEATNVKFITLDDLRKQIIESFQTEGRFLNVMVSLIKPLRIPHQWVVYFTFETDTEGLNLLELRKEISLHIKDSIEAIDGEFIEMLELKRI